MRKVRPNARSPTGFYITRRGEKLEFESELERDAYLLLDYESYVVSMTAQPLRIGAHVPDCLVKTISGLSILVDVKLESEITERWEELSATFLRTNDYFTEFGLYGFITDMSMHEHRFRLDILKQVSQKGIGEEENQLEPQILGVLGEKGILTIGTLLEKLDSALDYKSKMAAICSLIVAGLIILIGTPSARVEETTVGMASKEQSSQNLLPSFLIPYRTLLRRIDSHPLKGLSAGLAVIQEESKLQIGQQFYEILDDSKREDVQVKSIRTGEIYYLDLLNVPVRHSSEEVSEELGESNLLIIQRNYPERYDRAKQKYSVIFPFVARLRENLPLKNAEVNTVAAKINVSESSIRRWNKAYRERGFSGLLTSEGIGGKSKHRLDNQVEGIITTIIDQEYLTKQRKKPAEIFRLIKAECYKSGKDMPSMRTIYHRIDELDPYTKTKMRFGTRKALETYGLTGGEFQDKVTPLHTVQIDHSPLDIRLVDDLTGEVVGKAWLTVALDVFSRCIWGYYLSFSNPNDDIVGLTILNGVQKKDSYIQRFSLSEWPVFGLPWQLHMDNGKDFRSKLVDAGCAAHRIHVMRRPVKTPRYGAYVERFFRTLEEGLIHNLRGTTFSNTRERADYDSDKEATLTIYDLEKLLVRFIVDEYHNKRHSELNMTPLSKWKEGLESFSIQPREPSDVDRFRLDFLSFVEPEGTRTIQRDGIHYKDMVYFHPVLNAIPHYERDGRTPRKYYTRYDPSDLRYLYLLNDQEGKNSYHILLLRNSPSKAFTLREIESTRRQLKERGNREPSESLVLETILHRKKVLEELVSKDKAAMKSFAMMRRTQEANRMIVKEETQEPMTSYEKSGNGIDYVPSLNLEFAKRVRLGIEPQIGKIGGE